MPSSAISSTIKPDTGLKSLKAPKGKTDRDVETYPATLIGELAYRFRELFDRSEAHPPPSSKFLAHTAHLVGALAKELRFSPLHTRSLQDLVLLNYLVTPRELYPQTGPLIKAARETITEQFFSEKKVLQALLKRTWVDGDVPVTTYALQQLALNIAFRSRDHRPFVSLISGATPHAKRYQVSVLSVSGSFALLSLARELGCSKAARVLHGPALPLLLDAENRDRTCSLDPLSRPVEYRFASLFLADLNRVMISHTSEQCGLNWTPTELESIDITRAWLEGSSSPLNNYIAHGSDLTRAATCRSFKALYQGNGVRNFRRLDLYGAEDPSFLRDTLAEQSLQGCPSGDLILCAIGSGDHNDAYSSRGWEFEHVRQQGEIEGWNLDFVEVRDAQELAIHVLRHGQRGSRIRVLHYFGHGSPDSGEFGQLERDGRSQLSLRQLFSGRDEQELLTAIQQYVDTVVLHTCSAAQTPPNRTRKVANLAEGIYTGTQKQVTVIGLTGNDAFHSLEHTRNRNDEVLFLGKPVWYDAKVLRAKRLQAG